MSRVVFAIALVLLLAPSQMSAAPQPQGGRNPIPASESPPPADLSSDRDPPNRALIRELIERESTKAGLPADLAEAVVFVESDYNSSLVGKVGEIGLMQVRPETAAMLGFRGSLAELARPEINIHYGVTYLAGALPGFISLMVERELIGRFDRRQFVPPTSDASTPRHGGHKRLISYACSPRRKCTGYPKHAKRAWDGVPRHREQIAG
jgi:hypothetical protein